jgi:hypothetical protein
MILYVKKHETVLLPMDLYGREIWFLTLREEYRPRVFENRVLIVVCFMLVS